MSETETGPAVLWHGRVSLYRELDGALVIAYQHDDEEQPVNRRVPAPMVKMMERTSALRGGLAGMLGGGDGGE